MKVHVKNTIKNVKRIDVRGSSVDESEIDLNSGQTLSVLYISDLGEGLVNIHVNEETTLSGVSDKNLDYNKDKNLESMKYWTEQPEPDTTVNGVRKINSRANQSRRSCCGRRR
ncbi:MAG TPA: hypothetical protein DHV30_16505 [Balneola sp.]|nr:hypothetical protein [Balneola sp.]|tara:strand:- start:205 stop:543 length:339 start_codon:yes stop_codon:yes gene_type:complete